MLHRALPRPRPAASAVSALLILVLGANIASADSRRFAWSYESTTSPAGLGEYEQWVTWKTDKDTDAEYDRLEFRQEFEYGLTDRLQLGFYFANWRRTTTAAGTTTQVRSSSAELIYNLTDPANAPVGAALYAEVSLGQEVFELEAKLLLEKSLGRTLLVANTVLESEWEHEQWADDKGVFEQTIGVSHQITPRVMLGAEGLLEIEIEDWEEAGDPLLYLGPNASVRSEKWWITTSPLFQLSSEEGEPNLSWRTLIGIPF